MQRLINENETLESQIQSLKGEIQNLEKSTKARSQIKARRSGFFDLIKPKKDTGEVKVKTFRRTEEVFQTFLRGKSEKDIRKAMEALLKLNPKKYHINLQDQLGETILMRAVRQMKYKLVEFLLNRSDVDVFHQDLEGETALMIAASQGHLDFVQALTTKFQVHREMKKGLNMIMKVSRKSALMLAAEKGHEDVVLYLLKQGANPNLVDINQRTAKELAKDSGFRKLAKLISKEVKKSEGSEDVDEVFGQKARDADSPNSSDEESELEEFESGKQHRRLSYSQDPTMSSVKSRNEKLKKKLNILQDSLLSLKQKIQPDAWDQIRSLSPEDRAKLLVNDKRSNKVVTAIEDFHNLIMENQWETAESKYLLDKKTKISIDEKDSFGESALMKASRAGNNEAVQILLSYGAKVNQRNNGGDTALMIAAEHNNLETASMLLDKGADMEFFTKHSKHTALMLAAARGHTEMCRLLINGGASPRATDKDNKTAVDLARKEETRKYLEDVSVPVRQNRFSTDPEDFT